MMKFYMTPGSCSTGIHILLEEIGLVFEVHIVNLLANDHLKPEYLAVNPKATIPTLIRNDGSAITDFQAIAWWLALTHPKRRLLPESAEAQAYVLEVMNYAVNHIHGTGFTRFFTTEKYTLNPEDHDRVKAQGVDIIKRGFGLVADLIEGRDYVVDHFTIADAALFYVEFWADRSDIALPANCQAHYRKMLERPAVRQVLAEEGYASALNR